MLRELTIQDCLEFFRRYDLAAMIEDGQVKELKKEESKHDRNCSEQ